ncbi:zinc transporter ZIP1-like [Alligator mississippiensis]|nr:zinc transporter ZIP1-like [Alligator mississippiensis]
MAAQGAELGCLLALLLLTLLCGLLPARLRGATAAHGRRPVCRPAEPRGPWLSALGAAAGGVFLAACLLDVVPDYLGEMREALRARRIQVSFPLAELVLALGFLLVLVLERAALECGERRARAPGEAAPLLPAPAAPAPAPFRALAMLLALSLHSVLEGLAVGLQAVPARALRVCAAILLHKAVIAVGLSLLLLRSRVATRCFVASVAAFALMSPLGIVLGMGLSQSRGPSAALAQCLLQGLAAGTFLYVTFLEILPHELSAARGRLPQVLALLLGFSAMVTLRFLG